MPSRRRHIDELAIEYLAAGHTIRETAQLCGCDESTIKRRLRNPEFNARVIAERQAAVEAIRGKLRQVGLQAVATLEALLASSDPKVQLGASKALLTLLLAQHPSSEPHTSSSGQGGVIEYIQKVIVTTEPRNSTMALAHVEPAA